tara:strand:- start:343 stop:1263 length:921 start_codon:yes stop_codon:yes gene_type:complete
MKKNTNKAKKILEDGGLVIFPTETVYGIGCNATDLKAIKRLYKIKKRPTNNPLICHFSDISYIKKNFKLNKIACQLADKFWPGPLTIILKKKEDSKIHPILSNNTKFVGCRIPKHPLAQKLLKKLNFPVAAPSANISNKLSATNTSHLKDFFDENIYVLDGGKSFYGLESTVIDIKNNKIKILRLGSITFEQIKKLIPNVVIGNNYSKLSPGQKQKHYSPNLPLRINVNTVLKGEALLNFGKNNLKSKTKELNLSLTENLKEASNNFYDYLHKLDNSKSIGIAVAPIPNKNLGKTINDRLFRASSK